MPEKKVLKALWKLLLISLGIFALWLFFRWVLPWILPFLIALLMAKLMEPAVRALKERFKIPRGIGSAVMTLVVTGAVLGLVFWGVTRLVYELKRWISELPAMLSQLPETVANVEAHLERLILEAPVQMQEFLRASVQDVIDGGISIPGELYGTLANWITQAASLFPAVMLFSVALVLSTYFISSDYPEIIGFLVRQIPEKWQRKSLELYHHMVGTVGKWLRAQGIMLLITFSAALIGLTILRVDYSFVIALLIALVDALPVLGAGLTLLPWAVYSLIINDITRGVGLAVLYAVISLLRGFLEPKLIGQQIGLHPLVMLVSMYIGFKVAGVAGIILFPLLITVLKQLSEWGYFKLWK